jgi:FtsZ-binding cell division protein ZapB
MISLEQIRLLEAKISRAIDLIRVLKEENAALRRGLDSAQKRMKELEGLVDGFKADQKEIESVIIRTLKNLDELEEAAAGKKQDAPRHAPSSPPPSPPPPPAAPGYPPRGGAQADASRPAGTASQTGAAQTGAAPEAPQPDAGAPEDKTAKGELDIF